MKEILVKEGDHVAIGDTLLRLDDTSTRANLAIITKHLAPNARQRSAPHR